MAAAAATLLGMILANHAARAEGGADVAIDGTTAVFASPGNGEGRYDGVALGAEALYRRRNIELGGFGEVGGAALDGGYAATGAIAGVVWQSDPGLRLSLDAMAGAHYYWGVDDDWFFGGDPGAEAVTPFAGGRARAAWVFGRGKTRFQLGVVGTLADDLTRPVKVYAYRDTSWSTGQMETEKARHEVGFFSQSLGFELGVTFGRR